MQDAHLTAEIFAPPADFDLKRYLSGAFGRFIGEPTCAVRVRFDRELVPRQRERPWQEGEVLVERADGSAEVTYRVCHTADLSNTCCAPAAWRKSSARRPSAAASALRPRPWSRDILEAAL